MTRQIIGTHARARAHTHTHAHTYAHLRTHTRAHLRTHTHTHTHTHTDAHTYTHTHTHTHTHARARAHARTHITTGRQSVREVLTLTFAGECFVQRGPRLLCHLVWLGYHRTERLVLRMRTNCASNVGALYVSAGKTSVGSWKSMTRGNIDDHLLLSKGRGLSFAVLFLLLPT